MRNRLAQSVLQDIRISAPHAVDGLSEMGVDARIDRAIDKAARYSLDTPEDFRAFVRLCLIVGPNFDEYPRFRQILAASGGLPMMELLYLAEKEDWQKAAQFDVVSRYREPVVFRPGQEHQQREDHHISLRPLRSDHTESYFFYALHPDVWRLARIKPLTKAADVRRLILEQERNHTGYAIVGSGEEFLGALFLTLDDVVRVSYWVARPMWGKGIATEALKQLTDKLHQENRAALRLRVDPGNIPSIRVAEKCGFTRANESSPVCVNFEA